jgi:maleate cis-trans isomerase
MRTMSVVERLEADLGKPVISTTAAALWSALRRVGFRGRIEGHGRLLREMDGGG